MLYNLCFFSKIICVNCNDLILLHILAKVGADAVGLTWVDNNNKGVSQSQAP